MCGIFGAVSSGIDVVKNVIEGIACLQYRGYDSAGCIFINQNQFKCKKVVGKITDLAADVLSDSSFSSRIGMAHTRWATHGKVTVKNAHPHYTSNIAIIHNGIVENSFELKAELLKKGVLFNTDTDTEIILQLLVEGYKNEKSKVRLIESVMEKVRGSFALLVIFSDDSSTMFATKRSIGLVVANNGITSYVASDSSAVGLLDIPLFYMEDNDVAVVKHDCVQFFNAGHIVERKKSIIKPSITGRMPLQEEEFLINEISEQPYLISRLFSHMKLKEFSLPVSLSKFSQVTIIACGSSFFAGSIARYWIQKYLLVPVRVEIASEFVWHDFLDKGLFIFISQSGETADTVSAIKKVKQESSAATLAIVNEENSTIARLSDFVLNINAGPEFSVAATKSFTLQLASFLCMVVSCLDQKLEYLEELSSIGGKLSYIVNEISSSIELVAKCLSEHEKAFYIGKGLGHCIANEGALKLKEIAYVMVESLPSGEMKHGSLALLEEGFPIIVIAPSNIHFEKIVSGVQEIYSRGGKLFIFTDSVGAEAFSCLDSQIIILPDTSEFTMPFIYTITMQLLARRVAILKGRNVDYPRNLAKSVTVE